MAATRADAMVVAAYGLILPQWVLDLPAQGCFNIHASLLPRWRGAAPIHRAIEAGDAQTGVTIMQMDAGLDTGAMLLAQALPILGSDTTSSLHDRLAAVGGQLMLQALERASQGALRPVAQPEAGVCYAHKIEKAESAIDWTQSAQRIAQRVRAFDPFPGATALLNGDVLKIWQLTALAQMPPANVAAGTVLAVASDGITVAAGDSVARLTELQKPGGKRLSVADFLRGYEVQVGSVFEPRAA
jgi:methionyl-tRNA formyltransferase